MALHRDIYWVGRQWAVTGFGVQAIDQRLKGAFDLEISRLWEDDLTERMHAHAWLNAADFDKALAAARTRFPEPPRKALPLVDSILELIHPASSEPSKLVAPRPDIDAAPAGPAPTPPAPGSWSCGCCARKADWRGFCRNGASGDRSCSDNRRSVRVGRVVVHPVIVTAQAAGADGKSSM